MTQTCLIDADLPDTQPSHVESNETFLTSLGVLQPTELAVTTSILADYAFLHQITLKDKTIPSVTPVLYTYTTGINLRYNDTEFKGLHIDSGAAVRSTGGISQFQALQRLDNSVLLDKTTAGSMNITFGMESTSSIGTVNLVTPIGTIVFHIVKVNTPFLLCLADIDKTGAYFNNITNILVQKNRSHAVACRYGHVFLL